MKLLFQLAEFYKGLEEGGVTLKEPDHIEHSYENDRQFTYDRIDIHHNKQDKTDE